MAKATGRKFAIGALVAGVAGYLAGILTAPKSGKETRNDIKDVALRTKAEAEKSLKALHSELNELITEGKTKVKELKNTAKADLDDALGKAHTAKQKTREILSAIHDGDVKDEDLQSAVDDAKKAVSHLKKFVKNTQAKAT